MFSIAFSRLLWLVAAFALAVALAIPMSGTAAPAQRAGFAAVRHLCRGRNALRGGLQHHPGPVRLL